MRVTNNGFGDKYSENCGLYGPVASWSASDGNTWTGNHWYTPTAREERHRGRRMTVHARNHAVRRAGYRSNSLPTLVAR